MAGYPPPPHAQYPSQPPPAWPGYGQPYARQPQRSVGMIVGGAALLFVSLFPGGVSLYNAYDYMTIDDRLSDLPTSGWVVEIVKEADLKRMVMFGLVAATFGIAGIVLGGFGLRKR